MKEKVKKNLMNNINLKIGKKHYKNENEHSLLEKHTSANANNATCGVIAKSLTLNKTKRNQKQIFFKKNKSNNKPKKREIDIHAGNHFDE